MLLLTTVTWVTASGKEVSDRTVGTSGSNCKGTPGDEGERKQRDNIG